jgi:hypothetical protein
MFLISKIVNGNCMKNILILFIFCSLTSQAQLDTLAYWNNAHPRSFGYCAMIEERMADSLESKTFHYICLDPYSFMKGEMKHTCIPTGESGYTKKQAQSLIKRYKANTDLLNSKLKEVKVLYIENPTGLFVKGENQFINDTMPSYKVNMPAVVITHLNLKQFTSLNTLYLQGNDSDCLTELPLEIYTLPIKTIYISWLTFPEELKNTIKKYRPDIHVVNLDEINTSNSKAFEQ